jgi:3',5'-cyclic-AMP phosphodiesterase
VFDDQDCPAKMRAFLRTFASVAASADVVLHTGDVIFDALNADRDAVARQWTLWQELAKQLPSTMRHALGNHDVWGKAPGSAPDDAKRWALDVLRMPNRYYAFETGGWKFIVLDSIHPSTDGWYTAQFDEQQIEWLRNELRITAPTIPIAIVSHVPILSASIFDWASSEGEQWSNVRKSWMHGDSHAIQAMLRSSPNVKVCVSGHLHLLDQVVYDGITYLGCGAVCGNGWSSPTFHQTQRGFAGIDFFADGSVSRTYHTYRWS